MIINYERANKLKASFKLCEYEKVTKSTYIFTNMGFSFVIILFKKSDNVVNFALIGPHPLISLFSRVELIYSLLKRQIMVFPYPLESVQVLPNNSSD